VRRSLAAIMRPVELRNQGAPGSSLALAQAAPAGALSGVGDPASRMNRIYRHQRHVYDLTRQCFLFGRDTLLARMELRRGDRVLEVGCGTARNLLALHGLGRAASLYGLDASSAMLATARQNLHRRGLAASVRLAHGLAEELCPGRTFGLGEPFDAIFFSYSLSMMPASTRAVDAALASLKPGRRLYIVDFWDQAGLPRCVRAPLERWLGLFGVKHRPELHAHLAELAAQGAGTLSTLSIGPRYAVLVEFHKR
jgi:S-adenosylmethionine-diacylgycerolhomoserine-N-methlytransferase